MTDPRDARIAVLERALRQIADMACMEHDDDEHTEDCGVTIARRALHPEAPAEGVPETCGQCDRPRDNPTESCANRWHVPATPEPTKVEGAHPDDCRLCGGTGWQRDDNGALCDQRCYGADPTPSKEPVK